MELDILYNQFNKAAIGTRSSHCKFDAGEILSRYTIEGAIGQGRVSTVWRARRPDQSLIAIKVFRKGLEHDFSEEVRVLNKIFSHPMCPNILEYLGVTAHVDINSRLRPTIHPCILFGLADGDLHGLIRDSGDIALGPQLVKSIMRDILCGLSHLHGLGFIHGDIKPSNILLAKPDDARGHRAILGDLGAASEGEALRYYGTREYSPPEVLIDNPPYTSSADIWAAFVTCAHMLTGDCLFDIYGDSSVEYGGGVDEAAFVAWTDETPDSSDEESSGGSSGESGGTDSDEPPDHNISTAIASNGDSSGDSEDGKEITYRHLMMLTRVLGHPPEEFTQLGRRYYNARGRLIHHPDIEPGSIKGLFEKGFDFSIDLAEVEEFLRQGLTYMPGRISADDALKHKWLEMAGETV